MALVFADRVGEYTSTSGTSTLVLDDTIFGYKSFASCMTTGDTCYYTIDGGVNWETGLGTFNSSGELERTTVYKSSASNAKVSFPIGVKSTYISIIDENWNYIVDAAGTSVSLPSNLIASSTVAGAAVSTIDITGLTLNADNAHYTLIFKLIATSTAANIDYYLYFDDGSGTLDTTASNYANSLLTILSAATASHTIASTPMICRSTGGTTLNSISNVEIAINPNIISCNVVATCSNNERLILGSFYKTTASTNLTKLRITSSTGAASINIGSSVYIYANLW